ncbi:MAG: DUF2666 family protein [Candidatus Diapherotrites archaeon]|uniref:DUF2666 family protein n=1 Tax=Candidatus Iainarchaeum sp. TaxID=3101447 RepID=A0A7J4JWY1_9ARCH|nr:MAG: hypothetical protein QT12_C0022G0005 [archaeon GW2011_AR21]MBS3058059.1 DUF2666 family protein [Candidatus Diapherotrites archaeon]HIH21954.1 DUF2666 family protein [Candidatus Diapherotrites archaeon]HIH32674.1 DUF2666 family protein [Candidatus Diapherotrites archaeon]
MSEKYIQMVANYDGWVAVKKLKIEPSTDSRTVMQFLASLGISLDKKVEENLAKIVDLKKLDSALEELSVGKNSENIALIIEAASSGKVNRVIKEICELESLQAKEKTELQEFCKVYALKKAFKKAGLFIDYSTIQLKIPGMKKSRAKKEAKD